MIPGAKRLDDSEASRLESLWVGAFGDRYIARNIEAGTGREGFWSKMVRTCEPTTVLEVGCNVGGNLKHLVERVDHVCGIDINPEALKLLRSSLPLASVSRATARSLPFHDEAFDLVFTAGVLIHQPRSSLQEVMSEVVRCSNRFVLCCEYYSSEDTEVPYRGERGALFKRDYGSLFRELHPRLVLREEGTLDSTDGFDDVTFHLLEKT